MPPAAALECERTGWTLLMIATVAPERAAASAARWPARPAPMINTSCEGMARSLLAGPGKPLRGRVRHPGGRKMTRDPLNPPVKVLVVDDHADVRFLVRA